MLIFIVNFVNSRNCSVNVLEIMTPWGRTFGICLEKTKIETWRKFAIFLSKLFLNNLKRFSRKFLIFYKPDKYTIFLIPFPASPALHLRKMVPGMCGMESSMFGFKCSRMPFLRVKDWLSECIRWSCFDRKMLIIVYEIITLYSSALRNLWEPKINEDVLIRE